MRWKVAELVRLHDTESRLLEVGDGAIAVELQVVGIAIGGHELQNALLLALAQQPSAVMVVVIGAVATQVAFHAVANLGNVARLHVGQQTLEAPRLVFLPTGTEMGTDRQTGRRRVDGDALRRAVGQALTGQKAQTVLTFRTVAVETHQIADRHFTEINRCFHGFKMVLVNNDNKNISYKDTIFPKRLQVISELFRNFG